TPPKRRNGGVVIGCGNFAPRHVRDINHGHPNVLPSKSFNGFEPPPTSDEEAVLVDYDWMKQPQFRNAFGQPIDIPHIAAVPQADFDAVNRAKVITHRLPRRCGAAENFGDLSG